MYFSQLMGRERDANYNVTVVFCLLVQFNRKCQRSFTGLNFARLRLREVNWTELWRKQNVLEKDVLFFN